MLKMRLSQMFILVLNVIDVFILFFYILSFKAWDWVKGKTIKMAF